ncbi:MAG: MBL fold metallo-hydrolase [Candidatus Aenigmatarchaeota archaeon]|nr:MAG: MBL fold metallo-hydrolase [Candidatus Aenigmarchaeota archaeon]
MVEITILGGSNEVGRIAILIEANKERFLFDYGIDVQTGNPPIRPEFPLTAMFISHAHIDHSGLLPELYKRGWKGNIYGTKPTLGLCNLLLEDSIKVQRKRGQVPHYHPQHIKIMNSFWKTLDYNKPVEFKNSSARFLDAGHIPGSASPLLETGGKRILYTGDIKFADTKLIKGTRIWDEKIDVLIMESTYHYKNHPDRKELEDDLRELVQNTFYNNGIVLLPSFAVGRTQELLSILQDLGFPIFLDGMGIEATEIILNYPKFLRSPKKLRKAFGKARKIMKSKDRKEVLNKPCIVISTAGMLSGGPIGYYIKRLYQREDCAIALTGYQVEGTVGRRLMDTGRYVNEGLDVKLRMPPHFMDFSAHCGRDNLIKLVKKTNPEKVIVIHGDGTTEFAEELRGMGFDARSPANGEKFKA